MSCRAFYRDAYRELELGTGYDPEIEPTFEERVGLALAWCDDRPRRVLDYGCGNGAAARRFAENGHTVTGVDISESAIRVARKTLPGSAFEMLGEDARIPFADSSFDACFCSEVLEHLLDVRRALTEIRRVLVPRGLLLVTVPFHGFLKNLLIVALGFERHFDPYSEHVRFFTNRSLERCLSDHGFQVKRVQGIGRFWPVYRSVFMAAERVD